MLIGPALATQDSFSSSMNTLKIFNINKKQSTNLVRI